MKATFNDSQLRIMADQMASRFANHLPKTFLARAALRVRREFLQKNTRERIRFARYAVREGFLRLSARMQPKRRDAARVEVPQDRLLVVAQCKGGLGDLIIDSAFLDRFFRECGGPILHVVVPAARLEEARFVFHDSPSVALVTAEADLRHASTPYDVIFTLTGFASYDFIRTDRVRRIAPAVLEKLEAAVRIQHPYRAVIDAQPTLDGLFTTAAMQFGIRRLDLLGWLGNVGFSQDHQLLASPDAGGYRRFEALGLAKRPFITIHNGWDNVAQRSTENATKGWPPAHFERFVAGFKERFPQALVVQLGAKTSRPIAGRDIDLLNDTTLHEAAWILKHSLLHVDGDSGLVHLARALHTKSLVLFGPTNHQFFRYAQNETCFSTICGNCWWSTHDWMRSCPRGLWEPECMKSIEPADVLNKADKYLRSLPRLQLTVEDSRQWHSAEPFDEWRGHFVCDALRSARASEAKPRETNLRVGILDKRGLPMSRLAAAGFDLSTFTFKSDQDPCDRFNPTVGSDQGGEVAGNLTWDFGSLYNIPEENGLFDAVVMPVLTDRIRFPFPAIKESLRVLKENGLLLLTYRFAADAGQEFKSREDAPCRAVFRALEDLAAAGRLVCAAAGGIVLRKLTAGRLFA